MSTSVADANPGEVAPRFASRFRIPPFTPGPWAFTPVRRLPARKRNSYDQWRSDYDRGDAPAKEAPKAVAPHIVPGVEPDYRCTAPREAGGLTDSPPNLVVQQVSATGSFTVVPNDGCFELFHGLWRKLK